MDILIGIAVTVAIYSILMVVFKIPSLDVSRQLNSVIGKQQKSQSVVSTFLSNIANTIAPYIPLSKIQESELQGKLEMANIKETSKQYIANIWVHTSIFIIIALFIVFINFVLSLVPLGIGLFFYIYNYKEVDRICEKRMMSIESELPRFTSFVANAVKTNQTLIDIFEIYNRNYETPLTIELSITIADMKTSSPEMALNRLRVKLNTTLMNQLIDGLISSLHGEDMSGYFSNLTEKMNIYWQQHLKEIALKKEPKVSRLAYILFAVAGLTLLSIMVQLLASTTGILF